MPLQLADSGEKDADGNKVHRQVTQFSMKPVEQLGLLKMDFLGLRNLDVIEDALDIIERSAGTRPDMANLPLDDAKTYAMLARGESVGVFQFESEGMQEALKRVQPTEFDDLVALVALYRPGAMDQIPTYARGKKDPDSVQIPDDRLVPIIGPTKGVILYQEQDVSRWDRGLIAQGSHFLSLAASGEKLTTYHLEAGIAYWHSIKEDTPEKWRNILDHYDKLLQLQYSPGAQLNRIFAFSQVHGKANALTELDSLNLPDNRFYHLLLAHLCENVDKPRARASLEKALLLVRTAGEKNEIRHKITGLQD